MIPFQDQRESEMSRAVLAEAHHGHICLLASEDLKAEFGGCSAGDLKDE